MQRLNQNTALLFNIQPFSLQDGPGIRTTVFFKGCNLKCYWCHNPESLESRPEIMFYPANCIICGACLDVCPNTHGGQTARFSNLCDGCGRCADECYAGAVTRSGFYLSLDELVERVSQDQPVYEKSGGGVTFSGGEPLLQSGFVLKALKALKQRNIHTALESAVNVSWETLSPLLPYVDLFFTDIKNMNDERHRQATGASNTRILHNIYKMSEAGVPLCLRMPIIPDYNDTQADVEAVARFVRSLPSKPPVELMPFHGLCAGKYQALNRTYTAEGLHTPDRAHMDQLVSCMTAYGISVSHHG